MRLRLFALCLLGLVVLPASGEDASADRILTGGRILTVDSADRVAEALAIRKGRILATGTTAEIERLAGPATERIDLRGRTATPGLIDAHAHFSQGGLLRLTHLDLSYPGVKSIADVVNAVRVRSAAAKPGEWILGRGWDEGKFTERRQIRAADLDAVAGDHPAWLVHTTGHYGVANAFVLAVAGITRDTPDPPGGVIDRDAAGEPTGVLKETAVGLVTRHIPAAGPSMMRGAIRAMAGEFNRECMTGVKDPGLGSSLAYDPDSALATWNAYRDVLADGALTVRVFALWHSPRTLEEAQRLITLIEPFGRPDAASGEDRLVSGGVKMFADGSGAARTAWTWQDWNRDRNEIDTGNRGYPAFDAELMRQLILLYHDAGLHLGVHAVGDRAIDWVVDSYALALERKPVKGLRHAIIHSNIPSDHALDAMAAMQKRYDAGYPEPSPSFIWWIGDIYTGTFGPERNLRLNPFRSFLDRGIHWASGSDFFVTPFAARYGLWSSIAREPLLGIYGGDPFGRGEAVDAHAALRSFTIWAAHQVFMDERTGSLEAGKRADIAVWDTDFYTAPAASIKDAKCLMTLFDGEVVHRSEAFR
jgi:predicted amidohydrolase YtcJ